MWHCPNPRTACSMSEPGPLSPFHFASSQQCSWAESHPHCLPAGLGKKLELSLPQLLGRAAGPGGSAGPMVASAPLFSPLCVTIQVVAGTHVSVTTSIVVFEKATFLYLLLHFIPFFCFLLSPWTPPRQLTPQLFFHYYPSSATSEPKFCTSGAQLAQSTATAGLSQ